MLSETNRKGIHDIAKEIAEALNNGLDVSDEELLNEAEQKRHLTPEEAEYLRHCWQVNFAKKFL